MNSRLQKKPSKNEKILKISVFVFLMLTIVALILFMWCIFSFKIPTFKDAVPGMDKQQIKDQPFITGAWAITNYYILYPKGGTLSFFMGSSISHMTTIGIISVAFFSAFVVIDFILIMFLNRICRLAGVGCLNTSFILLSISFLILLILTLTIGKPVQQDTFTFFNWDNDLLLKHTLFLSVSSWVTIGIIGFTGFISLILTLIGGIKMAIN